MAKVNLRAVYINDVADPSDMVAIRNVRANRKTPSVEGTVRRGAGGRVRTFLRAGRSYSWALTFGTTTPEQKQWLEDHLGRLVCVRDSRGTKVFGTYLQSPWSELHFSQDAESAQMELVENTYSEAV